MSALTELVAKMRENAKGANWPSAWTQCADELEAALAETPNVGNATIDLLVREIARWQDETFPQKTPHSVATHLLKEAGELVAAPTDAEEIADVFMLCVGAANVNGVDLAAAVAAKLAKNKARTWGKPDADGVVQHVEPDPMPALVAETERLGLYADVTAPVWVDAATRDVLKFAVPSECETAQQYAAGVELIIALEARCCVVPEVR